MKGILFGIQYLGNATNTYNKNCYESDIESSKISRDRWSNIIPFPRHFVGGDLMKMLGLTPYKSSGLGHSEMGGQSDGLCSAGPASAGKTTADKGEGIKYVPSYILHPKSILYTRK